MGPDGTGDFPNIQAAIDTAMPGDTIQLMDGVYNGEGNQFIDFLGKAITVESQSGNPEDCIIAGELGFYFHSGEGRESVLSSVSVTGGYAHSNRWLGECGGNIVCSSSPTIRDCIISGGWAEDMGGGMFCAGPNCSPLLERCVFRQNRTVPWEYARGGGAIYLGGSVDCTPEFVDCEFIDNQAQGWPGGAIKIEGTCARFEGCLFEDNYAQTGGAVSCVYEGSQFEDCMFRGNRASLSGGAMECWVAAPPGTKLTTCTFVDNEAERRGGGLSIHGSYLIRQCTIYGNTSPIGAGINTGGSYDHVIDRTIVAFNHGGAGVRAIDCPNLEIECSDFYGNENGDWVGEIAPLLGVAGNIAEDPLFCDAPGGIFRILETSPCAPWTAPNPECDLIGAWPYNCDPLADVQEELRIEERLFNAMPNPFTTSTRIELRLAELGAGQLRGVTVHDLSGRRVKTLLRETGMGGTHNVVWNGDDDLGRQVPTGVYYLNVRSGDRQDTRQVFLLR